VEITIPGILPVKATLTTVRLRYNRLPLLVSTKAAARKARRVKQGRELWPGDHQQADPKGKGPSADVNMVFMLPMEFLVPSSDDELEFSDQIAQLALDPMTAIFEKSADDERQHLKALFVKGRVDG